jgi:4-hydroxythreonine-4-phosphate dehydrogenase
VTDIKPRIALTLGDVAGIGPEIVVRAVSESQVLAICRPIIVGHPEIVLRTATSLKIDLKLQGVASLSEIDDRSASIPCWNSGRDDVVDVPMGRSDPRAGRAAYHYLVGATRAALTGAVDAIVTAPLNKAALYSAGLHFPGHTEILAAECDVDEVAMMLYLPPGGVLKNPFGLGVAHATLHTSIRSVPHLLTVDRIFDTIRLLERFLQSIGCAQPCLGVAALNPHAGEEGLFGDEEQRVIGPAIARAHKCSGSVAGPIPADSLFRRAAAGEFDGVVAMYHDQGHIALKLLGYDRAVNITLGLPIIRTSPSHGTAFDIAGKGRANVDGFREAIRMAVRLVQHRTAGGNGK